MPVERLGKRRGMHESVRTGNTVYISGQVSTDETGQIVGKDDIEAQIEQVYKNLERHCRANGGTLRNIVKTTTYVSDGAYRAAIAQKRAAVYGDDPPTSTTVVVAFPGPDRLVEIEAIAYIE